MFKKGLLIVWISILIINTICIGITFIGWLQCGPLYKCTENEKVYISKKLNLDYDFDYILVHDNHLENRVVVICKNKIPFFNLLSGVETVLRREENPQLFEELKTKYQHSDLIEIPDVYTPYIIIYILIGLSYFFIRKH